jgi:O-antigen/teichoic acid export membrane protein
MIKRIKSLLFENRHARQTVAKNTFWLSIGAVASRVIKAVIIIYAARILGAENYGVFSYALSLAAMFSILSDAGVQGILTREISRNPEALEKTLATSFVIKLCLVVSSVLLIVGVGPFVSTVKGAASLLPLAALLTAFDSLRDFSFSISRSREKMEIEGGIGTLTGVSIAIFGLAALWVKPTPFVLMIGYVMGSGLGMLIAFLLLGKYLKNFWKLFEKDLAKKILKDALPFALMSLLGALTVNTDTIMIGLFRGARDVGLYAAAQRPVILVYLLAGVLATSVFPLMARLSKNDNERFKSVLEKTVSASLLFAIPVFVGGAVLAQPIIFFLFGQQYASTAATFAVLLFTVILLFPASTILNAIFAYNEQKILLISLVIGGLGNALFDYLLIPRFGIIGSSFATVISQALAYGFAWKKMKSINNFYTLKHLKKGFLAVTVMGLASFAMNLIHLQVLLNITVSAVIYLGILVLLKEKLIGEAKSVFHLEPPPPET